MVGRHATLTQKSRVLKEATLRVFAGWTADSDMPKRYTHLYGNAACEEILEEYGLLDRGIRMDQLKPKTCTNCIEPNKIDSKFCVKCTMVLSYDAYEETLKEQEKQKMDRDRIDSRIQRLEQNLSTFMKDMEIKGS